MSNRLPSQPAAVKAAAADAIERGIANGTLIRATPAAATDAQLLAAIDRGIANGSMIVIDDAFLAQMAAEIDGPALNTYRVWSRELVRGRTVSTHRDVQAPTELAARELRETPWREVFGVDLLPC